MSAAAENTQDSAFALSESDIKTRLGIFDTARIRAGRRAALEEGVHWRRDGRAIRYAPNAVEALQRHFGSQDTRSHVRSADIAIQSEKPRLLVAIERCPNVKFVLAGFADKPQPKRRSQCLVAMVHDNRRLKLGDSFKARLKGKRWEQVR